jgi:hypothetical protein
MSLWAYAFATVSAVSLVALAVLMADDWRKG